jgi:hypothetical protein
MGNSPAGRLTSTYFGGDATVLGAVGQSKENSTIVTANLPPYTPSGTVTNVSGTSTAQFQNNLGGSDSTNMSGGVSQYPRTSSSPVVFSGGTGSFNGAAQGGTSTPVRTVQPTLLGTIYIKL